MVEKGARVGAILKADEKEVHLIGYGVYQGLEVPPVGTPHGDLEIPNPKIELDSGAVVWGYECWWGPESQVEASIGTRNVVPVYIEAVRGA